MPELNERSVEYLTERLRWLEHGGGDILPPRTSQLVGAGSLVQRCAQAIYRIELVLAYLFATGVDTRERLARLEVEVADQERELRRLRRWCQRRCQDGDDDDDEDDEDDEDDDDDDDDNDDD